MIKSAKTLAIGCLTIISIHSQANGIILNEENLRNDLNWLNQQGVIQISTSTWPLSEAELSRALSKAVVNNN
ncbi:capsule assembly Wzi family protein, partial [Acinetobacter baumannii]